MMRCKPCGRPLTAYAYYRFAVGNVVELVCWTCLVWARTGHVMPERRV